MALGINRETAAEHLVGLGCGFFGESFWELGSKCQIRAQLVNPLRMRSLLERRRGGRGEGGIFHVFYVFFWFRHRFLFFITIINLLQQNAFHWNSRLLSFWAFFFWRDELKQPGYPFIMELVFIFPKLLFLSSSFFIISIFFFISFSTIRNECIMHCIPPFYGVSLLCHLEDR